MGSFFNKVSARNTETVIDQTADASDSGQSEAELELEDSRDTEDPPSPDLMDPGSDQAATTSNSKSTSLSLTCT